MIQSINQSINSQGVGRRLPTEQTFPGIPKKRALKKDALGVVHYSVTVFKHAEYTTD